MKLLLALLAVVLAGCGTTSMRRDLDVTGSLPRLIGVGGFAPTCFFLCFIENTTKQGDIVREGPDPADITVQSVTTEEVKPARLKRKVKP